MKLVCACAVFVVLFRPSLAALLVSRPTLYPFLYLLQPTGPAAVLSRQYVQDRMVEVTIYIYIYIVNSTLVSLLLGTVIPTSFYTLYMTSMSPVESVVSGDIS